MYHCKRKKNIMRKKIVAGNWKMNLSDKEGHVLVETVLKSKPHIDNNIEVCFAPPALYLKSLNQKISDYNNYVICAQNMNGHHSGAFTGEISSRMLLSIDINHVLIGHSERRNLYDENPQMIQTKVNRGFQDGMNVMLAVGEHRSVREQGNQQDFVQKQLDSALLHYSEENKNQLTIAYEPVWAIGTGLSATPEQAQDMHEFIRRYLNDNYDGLGESTSILYGGSVNPDNAEFLFAQSDV